MHIYLSMSPVRITGIMHNVSCVTSQDHRNNTYLSVSPVRITEEKKKKTRKKNNISICVTREDYRYDACQSMSPVRISDMMDIYVSKVRMSPVRITAMLNVYLCLR